MYTVTEKFLDVVTGTHRAVTRVQVLTTVQFGPAPTGGVELPVRDGDALLPATKAATLELDTDGGYWPLLQPYGNELFAERGVDYGDGTRELVPLGYFRIEDADQDDAPFGPIRVRSIDRTAQLRQARVLRPYQVPPATTHRQLFERLVNGDGTDDAPGMYRGVTVPILWPGYDPDEAIVPAGRVVEDDAHEFLTTLAGERGCLLRFAPTGELRVELAEPTGPPVYAIAGGRAGTLVRASRTVTRAGVYNIVSAYGSDTAHPTGYQLAYNNDVNSPLYWRGRFGPAPRYYSSPLLATDAAAEAAAKTVLGRYTGLPATLGLFLVPNPSLQPLDVVAATIGTDVQTHTVEQLRVPLAGGEVEVFTRTRNAVEDIETQPDPTPTPDPDPDPDPDPGTPPVGGNPSDGAQAAALLGWGPVVDGDEFAYNGPPDPNKWGVYNGPGHDGNGLRRPSAFNVADGMLTLTGDNVSGGTTGGMAFRRDERYCRIEVRMRTYSINPSAGGNRYHPVLITWPTSNEWPEGAEYDYFETDCDSGELGWFLHYPNHQPKRQEGGTKPLDIQNWHNYAFEWSPSGLRAWCDGVKYFEYTMSSIQAPGPMHLTYQLDNFFGSNMCPARMEAQWVRIYQRPGA